MFVNEFPEERKLYGIQEIIIFFLLFFFLFGKTRVIEIFVAVIQTCWNCQAFSYLWITATSKSPYF